MSNNLYIEPLLDSQDRSTIEKRAPIRDEITTNHPPNPSSAKDLFEKLKSFLPHPSQSIGITVKKLRVAIDEGKNSEAFELIDLLEDLLDVDL